MSSLFPNISIAFTVKILNYRQFLVEQIHEACLWSLKLRDGRINYIFMILIMLYSYNSDTICLNTIYIESYFKPVLFLLKTRKTRVIVVPGSTRVQMEPVCLLGKCVTVPRTVQTMTTRCHVVSNFDAFFYFCYALSQFYIFYDGNYFTILSSSLLLSLLLLLLLLL